MWVKNLTTSFTINVHIGAHLKVRRDIFAEVRFAALALLSRGADAGTFPADSYLDKFGDVLGQSCNEMVFQIEPGRKFPLESLAVSVFSCAMSHVKAAPLVAVQSVRVGMDEYFRNSFAYLPVAAAMEISAGRLIPARQSYRDEVSA